MQKSKISKLEEIETLKRLLLWVAFSKGENKPTPSNIYKHLDDGWRAIKHSDPPFNVDNIKTWLNNSLPVPKTLKSVLLSINWTMELEEKEQIRSLSTVLVQPPIWNDYEFKIESYLGNKINVTNFNNILIAAEFHLTDPTDIDTQIRHSSEETAIKAHLLYHSPVAADLWKRIKLSPNYASLYQLCQQGLRDILNQVQWKNILNLKKTLVFNLGVGASHKDKMIQDSLMKYCQIMPTFCWVDASYAMLHKTLLNFKVSQNIYSVALLTDFEHPDLLKTLFESAFPHLPKFSDRLIFFILGFTLSNLNESYFFKEYAKICKVGDIFVFPMQFIPINCRNIEEELTKFTTELLKSYDFDEGKTLSKEGLKMSQEYETIDLLPTTIEPYLFNNKTESLRLNFKIRMKHKIRGNYQTVMTAQSIRHYKDNYLTFLESLGFMKIMESETFRGVQTLVVEYVGITDGLLNKSSYDIKGD